MTLRDIPAIGQSVPSEIRDKFERVREAVQALAGFRGDPLDRALTVRDLKGGTLSGVGSGSPVPGPPGPPSTVPGPPGPGVPTPDLTPPPTVAGLTVSAGFSYITVQWDAPTYTEGNGHLQTNIYAVKKAATDPSLPTFASAVKVYSAPGPLTIAALPSEMNTRWHVWAKWETVDNIESTSPAGGTNGVSATTGQDVTQLLSVLTGQITESQLYSTLGSRINLIDGPTSLSGSVAQRVLAEATARGTAIANESAIRVTAEGVLASNITSTLAVANAAAAAVVSEQTARTSADSALSTSLSAVTATASSNTAAIAAETTARASADTALSTSIATVSAANASNAASITAEQTARINGDAASATLVSTLQSSIGGAGGNLAPNSSFDVDPNADGIAAGWGPYNNSFGAEPHVMSLVAGRLGGLAQRIAWSGSNTSSKGINTDSSFNDGGVSGGVRGGWKPGKTYVVSWWAIGSAAGVTMQLAWNINPATTTALLNPPLSATQWQRYAFRITMGTTVENNGRIYVTLSYGTPATGYIDHDDLQVQEGDLLTGYAPGDQPQIVASVQQETTTRAAQTGALFAQWTVKVDANGYVSGFGLASTANNAAPTSAFVVRADSFSVSSPSGPGITPATPFVVVTTPTTVNGVAVPIGVYMDAAYMLNGSITNAKLGNAVIDNAKIANLDAAKITTGLMDVNRLMVAGMMQADNVLTRGLTVRDASGNIILSAGAGLAWTTVNGAGKPADNATSDVALAVTGTGLVLSGNRAERTGGGAWDAQVYSLDGYTGGAYASFIPSAGTSSYFMAGLNTDPTTDSSYFSLDYAFYMYGAGELRAYESGNDRGPIGTYSAGDVLTVSYDGVTVRYMQNGVVLRAVAASAGLRLYFDSSIVFYGLKNIRFGPMSGIPASLSALDSAAGTKLGTIATGADVTAANTAAAIAGQGAFATLSQINSSNASTYIANAAIGTAQISSLNASVIVAGTITTDRFAVNAATAASSSSTTYTGTGFTTASSVTSAIKQIAALTTTGAPVTLNGQCEVSLIVNDTTIRHGVVYVDLYLDSTIVRTYTVTSYFSPIFGGRYVSLNFPLVYRSTPSAAAHTWSVRIRSDTWQPDAGGPSISASGTIGATMFAAVQENKV